MAEYKFLDDLAKFSNSTITAMTGMQRQVRKWAIEHMNTMIESMELVTKKELDVYKEIAQQALAKVEVLEKRVNELDGGKAKPAKKPKTNA